MSPPRPVRISRGGASAPGEARRSTFAEGWVQNRAGEARAIRIFGLFASVLTILYVAFVALAELGPNPGVRSAPVAWEVFTVIAIALAAWGWSITFGRTPRSSQRRDSDLLVRERLGRVRRFPVEAAQSPKVVQRFGVGLLGPEATEVVELATRDRVRRTYIVGERYFEQLAGG